MGWVGGWVGMSWDLEGSSARLVPALGSTLVVINSTTSCTLRYNSVHPAADMRSLCNCMKESRRPSALATRPAARNVHC